MTKTCRSQALLRFILILPLLFGPNLAQAAEPVARSFYVEDIKSATSAYIENRTEPDGVFRIVDPVVNKTLELRFVKIHDPVRQIDGGTYFACTDFEVMGEPDKLYDLDFWLTPAGEVLEVVEEKIHKEPRRSLLYGWYKHPRYTFVDDKIVPLYED